VADYDHRSIEPKWQRIWNERGCFEVPDTPRRPRYYCLEMLPYPSGRIHMGHVRNYSIGDVVARFRTMRGYDVLHPMGWDSFGLPAENAAIERGRQPMEWTESNIADMRGQLQMMGFSYAWSREFATHRPDYYRWNQWFFIQMHRKGLAYRSLRQVNWCPQCATVLANEQVEQGACWRCGTTVTQTSLEQWFFRISAYAQELLDDLDVMPNWPDKVRTMQRNWIGRSEGAFVEFPVEGGSSLRIFTTRIDTIYGATFLALSPEHPLVAELLSGSSEVAAARRFIDEQKRAPVGEKLSAERDKSGVFTGRYAINPFTQERIPIWLASFVLMDYGTGAIMGVPAHDERDHEFATRYRLPIRSVLRMPDGSTPEPPFTAQDAVVMASGPFTELRGDAARQAMAQHARAQGWGEPSVLYRLRDWGISRQRYWGTPIPMIHCDGCGVIPVPDADLPVRLPEDVVLTGRGGSPLARSAAFMRVDCPTCRNPARRDTDTMDTFVDSAWYFYRYLDPRNEKQPFAAELSRAWFPIDLYIGGISHAILHLMYARFFSMVMRDLGLAVPAEPVNTLLCQGMVLKGGTAMSKSKGNVVAPDEMVEKYGADVTRLFVLFAAPPEKDLEWSEEGIEGQSRFLKRVWRLIEVNADRARQAGGGRGVRDGGPPAHALRRQAHITLARVTDDIERRLHLNTAIAASMELVNALYQHAPVDEPGAATTVDADVLREALEILVTCLSPFAPHMAEEAWQRLGHDELLALRPWPAADPALLTTEEVTVVVQVDGKVRGRVQVPAGSEEITVIDSLRRDERLSAAVFPGGRPPQRTVYVKDKLINVVTNVAPGR